MPTETAESVVVKSPLTISLAILLLIPGWSYATAQQEGSDESAPRPAPQATDTRSGDVPIPPKVQAPPDQDVPTVSIRTQDNGDRVEEYRQNGRLYMVKVTPERAPPYYLLDTNGDGRLDAKDGEGRVAPVYWTIYEWD